MKDNTPFPRQKLVMVRNFFKPRLQHYRGVTNDDGQMYIVVRHDNDFPKDNNDPIPPLAVAICDKNSMPTSYDFVLNN